MKFSNRKKKQKTENWPRVGSGIPRKEAEIANNIKQVSSSGLKKATFERNSVFNYEMYR